MTAPTLPELDTVLLADAVPPCEGNEASCEDAAGWVIRLHCGGCEERLAFLLCAAHKDDLIGRLPRARHIPCPRGTALLLDEVTPL